MGLLSFLSTRKPTDRSLQPRTLVKSQAYETTAASLPPIRGTYPVSGNGPAGALDTAPISPVHRGDFLLDDDASEASAPAPIVPRFRELAASTERPRTAPNGAGSAPPMARRRRRESLKAPPIAFRKHKAESISSVARSIPESRRQPPQTALQPPPAPFRYQRSNSIHSISSGRGFVDLLDAQSELKPQGFQTRVKAAGVRDFGEDVADRNLGENGLDLASPRSQAFYARSSASIIHDSSDGAPAPSVQRSRFGTANQLLHPLTRDTISDLGPREPRAPFINGLAQNPAFAAPGSGPQDERQASLRRHLSQTGKAARRQSLSSYIPSVPTPVAASPPPRPQSMHRPTKSGSFGGKDRFEPPAKLELPLGGRGWTDYSHLLPKGEPVPPPSPSFARDSVLLARSNYSLPSHCRTPDRPYRERPSATRSLVEEGHTSEDRPSAARSPSPGPDDSNTASASTLRHVKQRRQSLRTDALLESPERKYYTDSRPTRGAGTYSPISPAHLHRQAPYRHDGWEVSYQRTKSMGSSYGRLRLDEIYEHIPIRTSSLIPTSAASTTPTISSTTSSQFPRPPSRHTPNTSIDLATGSSLDGRSPKSPPKSPVSIGDDASSYWTAMEYRSPSAQPPLASPTYEVATASFRSTFNIDDYLSSDDELDEGPRQGPRRPRGEAERELLFQDSGYGGLQLPGLYDSFPVTDEKGVQVFEINGALPTRQQSPGVLIAMGHDEDDGKRDSFAPGYGPELDEYYSGQYKQATPRPETQDPPFAFEDDEPPTVYRTDLATGRKGMTRISALGTSNYELPAPILEEREDKVDIRTAVRLRKEAKARRRAEGESIAREKMNEKRKQSVQMMDMAPVGQVV